jgi:N-acetylneuraminate synthase
MDPFRIGDRVCSARDPLIVPEIGINHGGSLAKAMELVAAAAECGAAIVKFQTHVPEDELTDAADRTFPANGGGKSIGEIIRTCALSEDDEARLKEETERHGMIYLSTPFSPKAVERLERLGVLAYKIGSGEVRNRDFVRLVASKGKPVIASTGMTRWADLFDLHHELRDVPHAFLHCVSRYPCPPAAANLGRMLSLPGDHVGYSDHCVGNSAAYAALAMGAIIVEKHFCLSHRDPGPDVECSADPDELEDIIRAAREIAEATAPSHGRDEDVQEETLRWVREAKAWS